MRLLLFLLIIFVCSVIFSCNQKSTTLFTKLSNSKTGIDFRNLLKEENPDFNIVMYPYFYNGGGVAIGDINNDGLPDICFTGNMVKNRLYLNKGHMQFEDITERSGIAAKEGWCTGVTMADVNGDGKLDIYVCRSGLSNVAYRKNLLFINNGDLTFTEKAAEYGLDDAGYSTQASFFDYDKDGDLDMMLINQSTPEFSKGKIEYLQMRSQKADSVLRNKLFRNDGGHFTDVSSSAGITSNPLSFSLGISTADINQDGWSDIYIANDFKEPDYCFINNKNGTFTESLNKCFSHTSLYAMGIDVADYNNDALPDLVELDMLPEGNHAQKMHMGTDGFDQYNPLFLAGMPYQYMKNALQKNNGDGTFSEIGQLAGISNTDWSWSPLLCDFDNDGLKDLFVSNGYKRDNTDIQFIKYSMDQSDKMHQGKDAVSVAEYISHMPSIKIENYIFRNTGNDKFVNEIKEWGFEEKTLSHGAAYADLDGDGDMDLVINNTDDYAGIYQNNSESLEKNNYLKIKLEGTTQNHSGIGAKLYVWASGQTMYEEQNPVRGYCSSVDEVLNFGLGKAAKIDSVRIVWPDDKTQVLTNVKFDQTLLLKHADATSNWDYSARHEAPIFIEDSLRLNFTHRENDFNDFTVQSLLPCYLSRQGPCMTKADVNGDGLEDLFIGGAKGQAGALFLQTSNGKFVVTTQPDFEKDKMSEDVAAVFFDTDGDGDMDLYVGSGGYEFSPDDAALQGRLYSNNGKGNFTKKKNALPKYLISTGCVAAADIDNDGDVDLFIGGRCVPGKYPLSPDSKILLNDGHGNFSDGTAAVCPAIAKIGMVTDAVWLDINKDGAKDILLDGEWMSPKLFLNHNGKLTDVSSMYFKFPATGWWNKICAADFDGDGDVDLILGNQGLNNQFTASAQKPISLYYKDFDGNGSIDPFLFYFNGEDSYPGVSRDDIVQQVPVLNKKYLSYTLYADVNKETMFTKDELKNSAELKADNLQTVYLENKGDHFEMRELPIEAQYGPVYAIAAGDFNKDGNKDFILAGNNVFTRIKFGRYDASHAMLFFGNGKGGFRYVAQNQSGLNVQGATRSISVINNHVLFGMNNDKLITYAIKQ